MKITKTGDKKYPLRIVLKNRTVLKVPKQKNFDNAFLRCHGCSLMAEYLALQYVHKHVWPLHLLRWHRAHDKQDVKAKVTLRGVAKGINHYRPDRAKYIPTPTVSKAELALASGACLILDHRNPIHSVFIVRDNGVDYIISYGKVKKVDISRTIAKATTNKTYRGMVIIK